jgi:hypothetical protein
VTTQLQLVVDEVLVVVVVVVVVVVAVTTTTTTTTISKTYHDTSLKRVAEDCMTKLRFQVAVKCLAFLLLSEHF